MDLTLLQGLGECPDEFLLAVLRELLGGLADDGDRLGSQRRGFFLTLCLLDLDLSTLCGFRQLSLVS